LDQLKTVLKQISDRESKRSTPQTGRTYTEGDMKEFAEYAADRWIEKYNDSEELKVEDLLIEYLKQNPKP